MCVCVHVFVSEREKVVFQNLFFLTLYASERDREIVRYVKRDRDRDRER